MGEHAARPERTVTAERDDFPPSGSDKSVGEDLAPSTADAGSVESATAQSSRRVTTATSAVADSLPADVEEPLDDRGSDASASVGPAPSRVVSTVAVALLVIAIAAVALGVYFGVGLLGSVSEESQRGAAAAAVRQEVTNLLTINPQTLDADIGRLLDGADGAFRKDFLTQKDSYAEFVRSQKVISTGAVRSAGIDEFSGDKAKVLVAAHATVKNAVVAEGEQRDYRMRATTERLGGRWVVTQLEFVP